MIAGGDPFRHIPHLRDRITHPERSNYRELVPADIDIPTRPDAEREASRHEILAELDGSDFWLFAYGSLMWDPGIYFAEVRQAVAQDYHRSFCLRSDRGRGSPEQPGLMAALDKGGTCHGLAYRLHPANAEEESHIVWRREMLIPGYVPTSVSARTPQGPIRCVAFVVDHHCDAYSPGLDEAETARRIAFASGRLGSNFAYLENLLAQFHALDIRDHALFALHERCRVIRADRDVRAEPDPAFPQMTKPG